MPEGRGFEAAVPPFAFDRSHFTHTPGVPASPRLTRGPWGFRLSAHPATSIRRPSRLMSMAALKISTLLCATGGTFPWPIRQMMKIVILPSTCGTQLRPGKEPVHLHEMLTVPEGLVSDRDRTTHDWETIPLRRQGEETHPLCGNQSPRNRGSVWIGRQTASCHIDTLPTVAKEVDPMELAHCGLLKLPRLEPGGLHRQVGTGFGWERFLLLSTLTTSIPITDCFLICEKKLELP